MKRILYSYLVIIDALMAEKIMWELSDIYQKEKSIKIIQLIL